ncbi:ABC transporter permease [Actinoallomurus purpureus]|uniref:ABC transporter permease n=1 Tax=Actinoallomurus purpureus TaxID=478114 RepID=UPI002092A7B1|nr:ABC transporter permease [Actinoallomurus purpureus]MCO6004629.1 ABC transporter permease [Actinoallomurus purpureus]
MSALSHAASDSATMLRRNLRHALRYPSLTLSVAGLPIIFLLLFVYVFGGALGTGIGGSRAQYLDYLVPGIILMTVASGSLMTAVAVSVDVTEGIIDRFRTMAISRASLLTGHVIGSLITTMFSTALVIGFALALGFRPDAGPVEWIATIGVLLMVTFALTWLAVALGVFAKSPESASNLPLPLQLLPMIGSGFVPTGSMPAGLRWFAEYQPFTPVIETLRGLLMGTPIGHSAVTSAAWCAGIALVGYVWAKTRFNRNRAR